MKVLVTGGTGFIGSHLMENLISKNWEIKALARRTSDINFLKRLNVEIFYGDLLNPESLNDVAEDIEIVYHLAGALGAREVSDKAVRDINVCGTENLLKACLKCDIKRFIHFSTTGVFGAVSNPPVDETCSFNPTTVYERSKVEGEKIVNEYLEEIPSTIVRPGLVYGPRDMSNVLKLIHAINNNMFWIIGGGNNLLSPIYVADLVRGVELITEEKRAIGESYIIASEEPISLKEFVGTIAKALEKTVPRFHIPVWMAKSVGLFFEFSSRIVGFDPPLTSNRVDFLTKHRAYDISKVKKLGFEQKIGLEEGMELAINWYKKNGFL